jgi:bifunctional UDP-N-acetylglucosamine pyrophosphorylase/glucosamine-1-phosphate N-acetyltransferase
MIGSGTKTGANSVLVAPLKLGKNVRRGRWFNYH